MTIFNCILGQELIYHANPSMDAHVMCMLGNYAHVGFADEDGMNFNAQRCLDGMVCNVTLDNLLGAKPTYCKFFICFMLPHVMVKEMNIHYVTCHVAIM